MATSSTRMSDEAFVDFCYKHLLRRAPDEEGRAHFVRSLLSRHMTREDVLVQFATCHEFESKLRSLEFVPPGHFYSAVPSIDERRAFLDAPPPADVSVPGVDLNVAGQEEQLLKLATFHPDFVFPERKSDRFRYHWANPAYSYSDALTLFSMIRHFRPKRVIEIGSGFTSALMLDTNEHFCGGNIEFTFIEPYPELLYSLIGARTEGLCTVIPKPLQAVSADLFGRLEANDILFVDSTHVAKLSSDVNRIVFHILPSLNDHVVIHFHDIFWPFEYPHDWIREGRAWNESYVLRAFLQYNRGFEILLFANYFDKCRRDWLQTHAPMQLRSAGQNIWLRKIPHSHHQHDHRA